MTDWLNPERFQVPVTGGELTVASWGDTGPVVLGIHGITASHMEWPFVARNLEGEARFVAPDLRGRGGSRDLPPPYGMNVHADDCVAVLDHLGVEKAVVVGHSMGGFVGAILAMHYPERVSTLVLVDGGVPLAIPAPEVDIEQLLTVMLGPSIERCKRIFTSEQEVIEFWKEHPAMKDEGAWNETMEAYVLYDLMGEAPELRSRVNVETVFGDGRDSLTNEDLRVAIEKISAPIVFMRAPRGILNEPNGLYADDFAAELESRIDNLTDHLVEDVNHFTLVTSERGAASVTEQIRGALQRQPA
jgi:lipase